MAECSDCLPFALSLHQNGPDIECPYKEKVLYLQLKRTPALSLSAGFQWDYVFDWTILKYQQTKNHAVPRPDAAPAAQADPADTDKGDRSGFARASRGDSGRRSVLVASMLHYKHKKHT